MQFSLSLCLGVESFMPSCTDGTSNRFFENEPNETCSKKRAKRQAFNFAIHKLRNHTSEGKGEKQLKERGEEKRQW